MVGRLRSRFHRMPLPAHEGPRVVRYHLGLLAQQGPSKDYRIHTPACGAAQSSSEPSLSMRPFLRLRSDLRCPACWEHPECHPPEPTPTIYAVRSYGPAGSLRKVGIHQPSTPEIRCCFCYRDDAVFVPLPRSRWLCESCAEEPP